MKQPVNPNANYARSLHSIDKSADYLRQTDTSLMQQYSTGDLQAFETLYNRHKGGLYRYFMRQIPEPSLAEDLYQEIWNKVILQAKHYKPTAKFTTWLYTLAHNKLVDHVRYLSVVNKVVVRSHDSEVTEDNEQFKQTHIDNELEIELTSTRDGESLKQCIGRLPQAQKDSFLLKEEAGLSVKDIATVLNTSFESSKSRLRYAYENLRQCLHIKSGREIL
ncbi:MAG: RNA polymerase sigma-70 factor (ECF subfamily) [Paraglaciecola sp.]